ncbi:MAG: hypothetical protein EHM23_26265 [Acidobacteria bacterium]|nr:MAG: hypothetical protein EHM23_26265 [Acidobacteriota bacterium]
MTRFHSSRRSFFARLATAAAVLSGRLEVGKAMQAPDSTRSIDADVGTLYQEIADIADQNTYPLSLLQPEQSNLAELRSNIRRKVFELFHYQPPSVSPAPRLIQRWEFEDYVQEKVEFSTTPWFRVPAFVLVPKKFSGRRPGIVDLHSHGGMFVFGKEKVMPMPGGDHPAITAYRIDNYEGRSTSLELCRRGYVVISIDCFYFGERRTLFPDQKAFSGRERHTLSVEEVRQLNRRTGQGEQTLAKSLFWAGTTWQGIAHWDDIRTIDYLVSRPEVDPAVPLLPKSRLRQLS